MKDFLRFFGIVQLFAYIAGIILLAVFIPLRGIGIFYFVMFIAFAPFFPFVSFAVAQILDYKEAQFNKVSHIEKNSSILVKHFVDDPAFKQNIAEEDNSDKIVFDSSSSKLTVEEKKHYKTQIQFLYNKFPFNRYSPRVKENIIDARNKALEAINSASSRGVAEKVVSDFKHTLDELK